MGHAIAKIDAKPLRDLIRLHDMSIPDIANRTGLSLSALHAWQREGKMPAYMGPVCVGLLAQITGKASRTDRKAAAADAAEPEASDILIVTLPEADREKAYKLLDLIGAKYKAIKDL